MPSLIKLLGLTRSLPLPVLTSLRSRLPLPVLTSLRRRGLVSPRRGRCGVRWLVSAFESGTSRRDLLIEFPHGRDKSRPKTAARTRRTPQLSPASQIVLMA
jgi:hypothetical protein